MVEGHILALAAASNFDPTARYVRFINDPDNGGSDGNNDYPVWEGVIETQISQELLEPTSLALLRLGLAGLRLRRRKR